MHSLLADVRFGLRQLWKHKMMTVAAMVSLGLAIGLCVAAFQLIDALFLRPLPAVRDPGSLYALTYSRKPTEYLPASSDTNSYPFFEHARGLVKSKARTGGGFGDRPVRRDLRHGCGDGEGPPAVHLRQPVFHASGCDRRWGGC